MPENDTINSPVPAIDMKPRLEAHSLTELDVERDDAKATGGFRSPAE